MDHLTLSAVTGAAVGIVVIVPMLFRGDSARAVFSAFFLYFFSAVLVFHARLPYLPWWAQGMGVTLMLLVPLLFTFTGKERKAIPVTLFNALFFGFLISLAEHYL